MTINPSYSFEYLLKNHSNNTVLLIKEKGLEYTMGFQEIKVGKKFNQPGLGINNAFIHKKDLNRATVFGEPGFVGTVIFEDDYERVIMDFYWYKDGDFISYNKATFKGDKDEVTFEDLEGRRYYFNKLIQRTIASVRYKDIKK